MSKINDLLKRVKDLENKKLEGDVIQFLNNLEQEIIEQIEQLANRGKEIRNQISKLFMLKPSIKKGEEIRDLI